MKRFFTTVAFATSLLLLVTGSSFAQSYPRYPYDYQPGNGGVMGIGPGGREAYHPQYYQTSPFGGLGGYGYGAYGYGPWMYRYSPNTTGLPSQPMAAPDSANHENYRSRYYTTTPSHPHAAMVDVKVPADAQLWFQGQQVQQKGAVRFFESPPLEQGKTYTYKVKAVWKDEKGKEVERTGTVEVRAGGHVTLDLNKPQS